MVERKFKTELSVKMDKNVNTGSRKTISREDKRMGNF